MSKTWWQRRLEAHEYIKYFFLKNKIKHKKNLDYYFTKLANLFLQKKKLIIIGKNSFIGTNLFKFLKKNLI